MSEAVKTLAEKYYPLLWPQDRMDALLAAGKLTQEEYDSIIGKTNT